MRKFASADGAGPAFSGLWICPDVYTERVQAMADFYNGPGNKLKYRNARREFFSLFPELAR